MPNFSLSGSTSNTQRFLKSLRTQNHYSGLDRLAQRGVEALRAATPVESGLTADSWSYELEVSRERVSITWKNSNVAGGAPVAILLQYGHGTGTGGYISGQDYINPALRPIFDEIADAVWKKVTVL